MMDPFRIVLRWLEGSLSYAVQFAAGLMLAARAVEIIRDPAVSDAMAAMAAWLFPAAILLLLPGYSDRMLARGRLGPPRLALDLTFLLVFVTLARALAGWLMAAPEPVLVALAAFWAAGFVAAFLVPGLAYRRLDPLPPLGAALARRRRQAAGIGGGTALRRLTVLLPLALLLPALLVLR
ncbi:hypothetical protein [Albidovulum sp.]